MCFSLNFFYFIVWFQGHFCTYIVTDKDYFIIITMMKQILIVCNSSKTSYDD